MIDTASLSFMLSVMESFMDIDELKAIFDPTVLKKQCFFDTVDEYIIRVNRIREEVEDEQEVYVVYAAFAIRILLLLHTYTPRQKKIELQKCVEFLSKVRSFTDGPLPASIRRAIFDYGCPEPHQAPKGWTCAICISGSDSHLCEKTACGHYFHFKCLNQLERSDNCPLCRQKM